MFSPSLGSLLRIRGSSLRLVQLEGRFWQLGGSGGLSLSKFARRWVWSLQSQKNAARGIHLSLDFGFLIGLQTTKCLALEGSSFIL